VGSVPRSRRARIPHRRPLRRTVALVCILSGAVGAAASAQEPERIDFARDIQPIFKTQCVGCHGPSIHHNGFRLDRRADAMRGGTLTMIGPGNADASRLYLRLTGSTMGSQMPPTGALKTEQIALIKAWIDQGADWPDAVSGETPPLPPDPTAQRLIEVLRAGNRTAFQRSAAQATSLGSAKGKSGTTPLMEAALYGSADDMRLLLDRGADVNARSDGGSTALIWASHDLEKTRLLLDRGADVNAASDNGRTALMAAVGRAGAAPVVKLLLERGANPSATGSESSVLLEATLLSEEPVVRMLLDAKADVPAAGPVPAILALKAGCVRCAEWIAASLPKPLLDVATAIAGPPFGDSREIPFLLDRGGSPNATDGQGRTVLMLAAATDSPSAALLERLVAAGADVNARTASGETALHHARLHGNADAMTLLMKAGAKDENPASASPPKPAGANTAREAIERSLPLLQQSDETFLKRSGCVSCHNNTLTAMTVTAARGLGLKVDEAIVGRHKTTIGMFIDSWRDRLLQGFGIPGDNDTISHLLLGLSAAGYPADAATDALAMFLVRQQFPDGHFRILVHRPPIESSDIEVTAATMRALQLYAPKVDRQRFTGAIARAAKWLEQAMPTTTEDRAFQLLGLSWAGAARPAIQAAARSLLATQRPDGAWAQTPRLGSDAYATGEAVYALTETGAALRSDAAITRGAQFLLSTQQADGSWFVQSRAIALQPLFESGFPHGRSQWISAAATNWAALALVNTIKKGS
jgi:ankyrin repeat protein